MKKAKSILILVCMATMVLLLSACGSSKASTFDWPTTGLATLLPEPPVLKGEIILNDDSNFKADICETSESDFEEYIEACKDYGFTIESDKSGSRFNAFNSDGYELSLDYFSSNEYYRIYLKEPILEAGQTFEWPSIGPATLLPEPSSNVGKIQIDNATEFLVYVGEFSSEEYESYLAECIEAGFDVDFSRSDTYYKALNTNGDELYISYEGFDVYYIRITLSEEEAEEDAPAEEEEAEIEEEVPDDSTEAEEEAPEESKSESAEESDLVDGMRPEFKKAMDKYEEFYDQYVELLEAYAANPTDMSLMSQYFDMLDEALEMDDAFEEWDEDEMNSAELAYYLEVSARVLQKLADIDIEY